MTEVLQPLNERVAEIVTKNADLLEAAAMEPLLLQLVAHVSAYRVIIKRCGRRRSPRFAQLCPPRCMPPMTPPPALHHFAPRCMPPMAPPLGMVVLPGSC